MKVRALAAALGAAVALAVSAGADDQGPGGSYAKDDWPIELTRRPLTLAPGMFELTVPVNVNASTDRWGEPVFINPALYYGVADGMTVGVRHFTGLCVSGEAHGCAKVYDDVGVDSIWSLARGSGFQLAFGLGLDVFRISDPTLLAAEGRIEAKWGTGPVAVVFSPTLTVGLTNRDDASQHMLGIAQQSVGNRESIAIPLQLQLQLLPAVAVFGGVALAGSIDPPTGSFGDTYTIPVSVGAQVSFTNRFDVGATLNFPTLGGANSTADNRLLTGFLALRL
jgi:hypothetical protein